MASSGATSLEAVSAIASSDLIADQFSVQRRPMQPSAAVVDKTMGRQSLQHPVGGPQQVAGVAAEDLAALDFMLYLRH